MIQRCVYCATLLAVAVPVHAVLWYGGDNDGRNGLANGINMGSFSHAQTYDNFRVTGAGWIVSEAWANCRTFGDLNTSQAVVEIRQGLERGNGGSIVFSGTFPVQETFLDANFSYALWEYRVSGLSIELQPGLYYLNVAVIGDGVQSGAWVATTSGLNGVGEPLQNGNSFFDSTSFGYDFAPASDVLGPGTWDFSFGLDGSPVPEPASVLALGCGLAVLLRRRRAEP